MSLGEVNLPKHTWLKLPRGGPQLTASGALQQAEGWDSEGAQGLISTEVSLLGNKYLIGKDKILFQTLSI